MIKHQKKESPRRNASTKNEEKRTQTAEQKSRFREYQKNYVNNVYRQYSLRFRADMDADVIAYLDDPKINPNLTNKIRQMVLAEIYKDDPREKDLNGRPYEVVAEFQKAKHENSLLLKEKFGKGL